MDILVYNPITPHPTSEEERDQIPKQEFSSLWLKAETFNFLVVACGSKKPVLKFPSICSCMLGCSG